MCWRSNWYHSYIDKINTKKKLQTSELYTLFLDNYCFKTNIIKIEFGRELSKFGLVPKRIKICGHKYRGYELDYNLIIIIKIKKYETWN